MPHAPAAVITPDGVSAAHVVAKRHDVLGHRIIAFVVASNDERKGIRREARAALTPARRPAKIFCLRALPTNANGKLDRSALPAPSVERPELGVAYTDPEAGLEARLAVLWADILGINKVGRNDNFFELGGHSLLPVGIGEL